MKELKLPLQGRPREELLRTLKSLKSDDLDWRNGRTFSYIYNVGDEIMDFAKEAFSMFLTENGLSPFAFPSLRKFETEVIAMTAGLLGGDGKTMGSMTSGGTESIFMAVKSAREWSRDKKKHITAPEMVVPVTIHPAFDKAAHYLDIRVHHAPMGTDFRVDAEAMKALVNENTIMMAGSAMSYPHGVIDPIEELAAFAAERKIWFHTDCCVGGFVLPFVRKLGYEIPEFDFAVPGVISISADVHKYGFAPKGASTVLYRNADYRAYQYFAYADWPGGVYGTSALAGARTGGALAGAWAVMNYLGEEGYLKIMDGTMKTTRRLIDGVNAIPGLKVLGNPHATIFAIASDSLNIYAVSDEMKNREWLVEKQHLPPCLHVTVSPYHEKIVEPFLADLAEAAKAVVGVDASNLSREAAMYGMMATMPDRKLASELAVQYLNQVYRLE